MFLVLIRLLLLSKYFLTEAVDCNISYSGRLQKGIIRSYNYPFNYENNLNCTYSIYFPESNFNLNKKICLHAKSFFLENSSPFCSFDYLKIGTPENSYKYCGRGVWQYGLYSYLNVYSSIWSKNLCWSIENKQTFEMTFISDNATVGQGFYIEYYILDDKMSFSKSVDGEAPCADEQWTCFNRQCIPSNKVCNGEPDCSDGSDESYTHARCLRGKDKFTCVTLSNTDPNDNNCNLIFKGFKVENITRNGQEKFTSLKTTLTSSSIIGSSIHLDRKQYCLSIWYTFNGFGNATVSVFLNQTIKAPEWSKQLSRKSQIDFPTWEDVSLNVENLDDLVLGINFELNENCWFGIKDISLSEGLCSDGELSCNFATSLCGWTDASPINLFSIPNVMSSSWSYMKETDQGFAHLNLQSQQAVGFLLSPVHQLQGKLSSISVKYYVRSMNEAHSCYISMFVVALNNSYHEIWTGESLQMNEWQTAYTKYNTTKPHQILIKGIGKSCFIFLKAITTNEESTFNFPIDIPTTSSPSAKDSTSSGMGANTSACSPSVSKNVMCNGIIECPDGIDESRCNDTFNYNSTTLRTPVPNEFLGNGAIAGIVIGSILIVVLLIVMVLVCAKINKSGGSDSKRSESKISILGQPFKFSSTKTPLPTTADLQRICSNIAPVQNTGGDSLFQRTKTNSNSSVVGSESDVLEFPHVSMSCMTTNDSPNTIRLDHVYEEPKYVCSYLGEGEASASSSFSYIQRHDTNVVDDNISLELSPMDTRINFPTSARDRLNRLRPPSPSNFKSNQTSDDSLNQSNQDRTPTRKVSIDPRNYLLGNDHTHQSHIDTKETKIVFPMHATIV